MFDWKKQVILLTGGTGSFGQKFTEIILKRHPPKVLRIFSRDEFKQYEMEKKFSQKCLRYFIGDVRDAERVRRAMADVTLVIHAAAMKQIVASEYNPTEAIKTNVLGTMNVLNSALDKGVQRVLGLITDKAVSPVNLYGATKLTMEKLLIQGNVYRGLGNTRISCVRYGNVAGSRGSVIPLFRTQSSLGKVTITHRQMTRFWITLDTAVNFVMNMIETMQGGEVFIPKMPSFKIIDLAYVIAPKAQLHYVGIRPGEKIHEDLITVHEAHNVREFSNHYVMTPVFSLWEDTKKKIKSGKKVPDNFAFNSGSNKKLLTKTELRQHLKTIDNEML